MANIFVTTDILGFKHIMDDAGVDAALPLSDRDVAAIVKIERFEAADVYDTPEDIRALVEETTKAKDKRERAEARKIIKKTIAILEAQLTILK
jgi:hypothetical protein